jgi:hypothetical protein
MLVLMLELVSLIQNVLLILQLRIAVQTDVWESAPLILIIIRRMVYVCHIVKLELMLTRL